MTTPLDKTLKRELSIEGRSYILALSPEGIKLTLKGKRNGQELRWADLISGDAALAVALNASVGKFTASTPRAPAATPAKPRVALKARVPAPAKPRPAQRRGRGARAKRQ